MRKKPGTTRTIEEKKALIDQIKGLMKDSGLTSREASEKAGISVNQYHTYSYQIRLGRSRPAKGAHKATRKRRRTQENVLMPVMQAVAEQAHKLTGPRAAYVYMMDVRTAMDFLKALEQ